MARMSRHEEIVLYGRLTGLLAQDWAQRGYGLLREEETYIVDGDISQFYIDAVSRDAHAHLGLAFLQEVGSPSFDQVRDMASEDGIDVDDSQEIFMMNKTLSGHLDALEKRA